MSYREKLASLASSAAGVVINLPVVEDVSFPSIIGAIASKPPKKPRKRPVQHKGVRLSRRPTAFEERVISLADIPSRFELEVDTTVRSLLSVREDQLKAFVLASPVAATNENTAKRYRLLLEAAQQRIAQFGAEQIHVECGRQGVVFNLSADRQTFSGWTKQRKARLLHVSSSEAIRLNDSWGRDMAAARERLYTAKPKAKVEELIALAIRRVDWGLKGAVRGILQHAFVASRTAEMRLLHRGTMHLADDADPLVDFVVQSAILDTSVCDPCLDADGKVFAFGSEEQEEHEPPYYLCDGGNACRCLQVAVVGDWRDRADVEDALDTDRVAVKTQRQADRLIKDRQNPDEDDTLD